jgi:Flp pilus assembly protein TadD
MSDDPTPSVLEQALAASAGDDTARAIELFGQACAASPADPVAHFLMGAELAQAGRFPQAEEAYARAVALAPAFAIARFELGTLQFVLARVAVALVTWQPLLELAEDDPLRLFAQGYGELAADRPQEALALFRRGMEANTINPALNANIRRLVAGIESARATGARAGDAPTPAPAEPAGHVLLDAYRHQGPVH